MKHRNKRSLKARAYTFSDTEVSETFDAGSPTKMHNNNFFLLMFGLLLSGFAFIVGLNFLCR